MRLLTFRTDRGHRIGRVEPDAGSGKTRVTQIDVDGAQDVGALLAVRD